MFNPTVFQPKVFQMSEMPTVEALPENNTERKPSKEELDHLRHERNVYEESYIRIQRQLDQIQKENESLLSDLQSKQDLIDGFELQLKQEKDVVKNEMEVHVNEMKNKMKERERELMEVHLEEKSQMESLIGDLKVNDNYLTKLSITSYSENV